MDMDRTKSQEINSISISILRTYKLIEYIELLSKHPEGLSRIEIRKKLPISSTPEIKCTEILYNSRFIENAHILKGRKFILSKTGMDLWKIIKGLDIFLRKATNSNIATEEELKHILSTIEVFQKFFDINKGRLTKLKNLEKLFPSD